MPSIGVPGLILILLIALIIFGPSKLPKLGKAIGETLREFRTSTKELVDEVTGEEDEVKAKKDEKVTVKVEK